MLLTQKHIELHRKLYYRNLFAGSLDPELTSDELATLTSAEWRELHEVYYGADWAELITEKDLLKPLPSNAVYAFIQELLYALVPIELESPYRGAGK